MQLEIVRLLQALSFPLAEIRRIMTRPNFSFRSAIELHLDSLKKKILMEQALQARLEELKKLLKTKQHVPLQNIIYILQIMDNVKLFGLNPQDEKKLKSQWGKYTPEDISAVENEWPALIAQVRSEMAKGTDPKNPSVQKLAKRWMELVNMFTAGIPKMAEQVNGKYKNEYQDLKQKHGDGIPDTDMFGYIQKALKAYPDNC